MPPKRAPAAKGKAAAAAGKPQKQTKAGETDGGTEDERWVRRQLKELEAQRGQGPEWLEEPHLFHEGQLELVLAHLQDGSLPGVPEALRDDVEFYVSQFSDGREAAEEDFYIDRETYTEVLAAASHAAVADPDGESAGGQYVRAPSSQAAAAAAEQLQGWSDASTKGVAGLGRLLEEHEASAEVQEVAAARLGVLLAEVAKSGAAPEADGLAPRLLAPILLGVLKRFPRDAGVQRAGCSALHWVVKLPGGAGVVADTEGVALAGKAMKRHISDVAVCRSAALVFYAMVQVTERHSKERLCMRSAGYDQLLNEALSKHPHDRSLLYAVQVAGSELKG